MSYRAEKLVIGTRMEIRMEIRHYDPQLCQTKREYAYIIPQNVPMMEIRSMPKVYSNKRISIWFCVNVDTYLIIRIWKKLKKVEKMEIRALDSGRWLERGKWAYWFNT